MKKILLIVLAICMMCCLVGCNNANSGEEQQVKYVLYCGLNDADTGGQVLTVEDAKEDARKIITDKGFGYTEYTTYGAYTENEMVKGNDTLVYVLFYVEEADGSANLDELLESLNSALDALTERESAIVILHYYHGLSHKEIAGKMHLSYANARQLCHVALKKLRKEIFK